MVSRPIRARIETAAIAHNYAIARRHAPHSRLWAVIKANAYGHGLWRVVEALRHQADGFAVLEIEAAVAMRESGITQPILLLEGVFHSRDVGLVQQHRLTSVVHCPEQVQMFLDGNGGDQPLPLYLKLNTGMNRLGFTEPQLATLRRQLAELPRAELTYMTHFADADGPRGVDWQLQNFRRMLAGWDGPVSLGNSAAILRHPGAQGDWVRPGIMLYGASPFADQPAAEFDLRPAMHLESRLIGIQQLAPGDRVGYGGSFVADRAMRVGIVACGYADGYPRHAPSGTPIAVCGKRTRTVGRVSMDMLACDITDIPEATLDAPVTLWGQGAGGVVDADEVAASAGTIAYELFCALAQRVPVQVGA